MSWNKACSSILAYCFSPNKHVPGSPAELLQHIITTTEESWSLKGERKRIVLALLLPPFWGLFYQFYFYWFLFRLHGGNVGAHCWCFIHTFLNFHVGSGCFALGICKMRAAEEILPKIQAYVKRLLICGLVVTIVTMIWNHHFQVRLVLCWQ